MKIDTGPRPIALANLVAHRLGLAPEPMATIAAMHGMRVLSHVGLRFGGERVGLSIYHSLLGHSLLDARG